MGIVTNTNYDLANSQLQKEPLIVLEIEGSPYLFSTNQVYTTLRYDDDGVVYNGQYQYDGLRPINPEILKSYIDRKGSFSTISQKLEQWDGKASVETFNLKIIDKDKLLTKMCSPGNILPEIMNRKVRIFFGYSTISYPEDYLLLFKGYVNEVKLSQGAVFFTFTDPSSQRKQAIFNATQSTFTADVAPGDTVLNVSSTDNFYQTITNAKGVPDSTVQIGLILGGKEIVTYTNADILSTTQIQVNRGQFGTLADTFSTGDTMEMFFYSQDNCITQALKAMLSGWNGPWKSDILLRGIINNDAGGTNPDSITFGQGVDVVRDFGLNLGDFVILSGSTIPTNNNTFTVADIINDNRTILVEETGILLQENPPLSGGLSTVAAIRSKYDTWPVTCGIGLGTDDVLVSQHEYVRDVFVPVTMKMKVKGEEKSAKQWIETHLFKPVGAYSLTQGASISVGVTHPPLITDLTKVIDQTNVVDAKSIEVDRGLNSRFFYNEILFNFDYDVINDQFNNSLRVVDADAQNRLNQVSILEIDCRGFTALEVNAMRARAARLLQRYKYCAETISLKTFFGVGHTIDAGDIIVLNDADIPVLQISNTETGDRGIYNRVMEVQERSIDISGGTTKLTLLSNNGFSFTDRYGVIGPSSLIDGTWSGTSTTSFKIKDSFGAKFPSAEYKKWQDFSGSKIKVHDITYTNVGETYFTLDASNPYIVHVSPALAFTPTDNMAMEFSNYDQTDATINQAIKARFCAFDPASFVFSGSSNTVFTLQSGYSSRYQTGMIIYVRNYDCTRYSPNVKITLIAGDVITIGPVIDNGSNPDLGFIPQLDDIVELAGFKDGGSGYKYI